VAEQERLTRYTEAAVTRIKDELRATWTWPEGYRDDRGRGWEKVTADAALRLGALARASWGPLTLEQATGALLEAAPTCPTGQGRRAGQV
jgi:hypothetical protein